jgi:phosphopantothenoylcysteine decarboxylase/phosphopantothenate--cysteine ligase
MLKGKKIALFVTGGIAVYKAVDLLRTFIKHEAIVKVAMTDAAAKFVSPLTFQILSKQAVHIDTFSEEEPDQVQHIHLADWADVAVIAPATANTLAKVANGIADNFVTSTLLATRAPLFVVPAMNTHMYENPATKENIATLEKRGVYVMDPDTGFLAEGYEGKGRYPENTRIVEELIQFIIEKNDSLPLKGKHVLVTAGGTKERIDPVRYISNDSSGKMGHRLAEAAYYKGAEVTLVTTSELETPSFLKRIKVQSAKEMYQAVNNHFDKIDVLIMAAAVSDYAPSTVSEHKMKKQEELTIELKKNPDILKEMGAKKAHQFLVGFAAETENIEEYATRKLREKNADIIVANDVGKKDRGFNVDENEVILYAKDGSATHLPLSSKSEIAQHIIEAVIKEQEE